jgi:hypothetical protein
MRTTHFIREIKIRWDSTKGTESLSVPLDVVDEQMEAYLDVMGCEWGRVYTRHGQDLRMLTHRTGARKGGHFLIKRPDEFVRKTWPVEVEWTTMSEETGGELFLEYVDLESAAWKPLELVSREDLSAEWIRNIANGLISPVDNQSREQAAIIANERRISPIEIVGVTIISQNTITTSIPEKVPFTISIQVECLEDAPPFCMYIQIYRSDGVYMFWQPSDYHKQLDTSGAKHVSVDFNFEENCFSSGDYEITATATTAPWHKDIVQSEIEVFDRKTSIARFSISREIENLQFGAVNYRAGVEIKKEK